MQNIKNRNQLPVAIWLWSGAGLIFLMIIVGGITRLTGSGLSMSDWNLIMGTIPPLNAHDWKEAFQQYQQFPEYQQLNTGMSLASFKQIFFWEYLHRILGRLIGIVFLIPAIYFWIRGYFTARLRKRVLILFGLGALQGAMGWIMVRSGLVDVPRVSHYRLALHFLLAIILITFCVWFALDLREKRAQISTKLKPELKKWVIGVGILFFLQVTWGAFTAGLDAGFMYNTFPLMSGSLVPPTAWTMKPVIINFLENPGTVQWVHRIIGTLLLIAAIGLWIRSRFSSLSGPIKWKGDLLLGLILLQFALGILTLVYHVPVTLGVIHQAGAILFWIGFLLYYHDLRKNYI